MEPNLSHFEELYAPVLEELEPLCAWGPHPGEGDSEGVSGAEFAQLAAAARCQQDMSPSARESSRVTAYCGEHARQGYWSKVVCVGESEKLGARRTRVR